MSAGRRRMGALVGALAAMAGALVAFPRVGADVLAKAPNFGKGPPPSVPGEFRVGVEGDTLSLSVAILEAPSPRGTVFVLHGIRDRKESMRGWGDSLVRAGFRAVLVDSRGHGRSTGDYLTYGVRESDDLVRVLDALPARGVTTGPVGALGFSYGAATALEWSGKDPRVRAVVAVAPFASLRDVVPGYLPFPVPKALVDDAVDRAGVLARFDPDDASPERGFARGHATALFLHGRDDTRIPPWHSRRIAHGAQDRATVVVLEGETHESIVRDVGGALGARVPSFFGDALVLTSDGRP
ncbi:MAG: alpha/beta fold hydrolase [Polyangiaceae bacterium]